MSKIDCVHFQLNTSSAAAAPESPVDVSQNAKRRARFAALAADLENFECDLRPSRPKESFLKGPTQRLSTGETSPAALFTPTASYYQASKQLSASSLPRIDEGKPVRAPDDETIPYVDDDDQTSTTASPQKMQSSESVKSSSSVRRVGSEKRLRFAVPICEVAKMDSSSSEQQCSHGVRFSQNYYLS
ncbi:unnamed protein product [Gongylonema pulchrum]|uniref:Uncharacterized protein n=1 Tax=Gongylonema pulchrum TaxID=637853 RepID=A0A3P6NNL7_9BILA|nr:unnamed protein product [Gongylonema pulchrum]